MGAHQAEHSVVAAAPVRACFEAVSDFAAYPEWASAIKRCIVHETDSEGRGSLVEFRADAKVREIRYVLRYHYEPPERVWWDYVEGDARSVEGEYLFVPVDDRHTRMTYRLAIDPGRFLPGPVKKLLVETVMKGSVTDLQRRVEQV
jgi:ribosome-associated toxin RatA of RatAB toxin-antitoxin module